MVAAGDWDLSYEYLTGTWMSDIIDEVNNDVDWICANAHEKGDEMAPGLFNIDDEDDFDDDTALDVVELGKALEGITLGGVCVDTEGNIDAPADMEAIAVDAFESDSDSTMDVE